MKLFSKNLRAEWMFHEDSFIYFLNTRSYSTRTVIHQNTFLMLESHTISHNFRVGFQSSRMQLSTSGLQGATPIWPPQPSYSSNPWPPCETCDELKVLISISFVVTKQRLLIQAKNKEYENGLYLYTEQYFGGIPPSWRVAMSSLGQCCHCIEL